MSLICNSKIYRQLNKHTSTPAGSAPQDDKVATTGYIIHHGRDFTKKAKKTPLYLIA